MILSRQVNARPRATLIGAFVLAFFALGCGRGCGESPDGGSKIPMSSLPPPDLRLVLVTDLMGQTEPCGCTSRPLGGLDLVAGMVREARKDAPTLAFAAGHLHFEGASIPEPMQAQARFAAETTERAISATPFDGTFIAAPRSEIERAFLEEPTAVARFGDGEPHLYEVGGRKVLVVGVEQTPPAALARVLAEAPARDVAIVLHVGPRRSAAEIAAVPGVDFVLLAGLDEEAVTPPRARGKAHLLTAGRQGQRILLLDLYLREGETFEDLSPATAEERKQELTQSAAELEARLEVWTREGRHAAEDLAAQRARLEAMRLEIASIAPPSEVKGRAFVARHVEIDPEAARAREVAELMRAHDQRVNAHNREAFKDSRPIPVDEGEPTYVGSQVCASCHAQAHAWWEKTPHGRAYSTLVLRHKEFNLACVGCHVTGYGKPGGATVTWNLDGALVNVGCEQCHGPGSAHASAGPGQKRETIVRDPAEGVCLNCHNHEHSDQFDFETYRARLLVPGHGR